MASVLVVVPLGLMLLGTGLFVNFLQLLTLVFVLPFSRWAYRWINYFVMDAYWSQIVWLVEWWGRLEVRIYADEETMKHMGKESALAICNHRSDVDWAIGWVLAQRCGCLGSTRALMKDAVQWIPVIGWSMWFSEYIFLARKWETDKSKIKVGYERLRDFPRPMWVALFVEGTRFTEEKLRRAQEFAASAGIPVPKNTLVPRTKGFVMTVENLREFVPAIYDITIIVPKGVPPATFSNLLKRRATEVQLQIRRVPMADLPHDSEGIAKWCRDAFLRKDEMLEEFRKSNTFDEKSFWPSSKSKWPLVFTSMWAILTMATLFYFFAHLSGAVALSWTSLSLSLIIVIGIIVFVQYLVQFTKSEYSTPMARAKAPQKATVVANHLEQDGAKID